MTEHIEFSEIYDASPHDVFRMVTRLDHLEEKATALGHHGHRMLELRERDGLFRSVTQRDVDVDLPRWAPGFIFPRNTIVQTQLWHPPAYDGSRRYEAYIEVTRVPVTVSGEGFLTGLNYTSTRYDIRLDIRSTFPLLGRKIEKFVAGQFADGMREEHEFRLQWLGRRRREHHSAWT